MITAYFASPDVFRDNAEEYCRMVSDIMENRNVRALLPVDNKSCSHREIYSQNISMIEKCSFVIANLVPFRGPSLDSGVAFEIGYAKAINKKIIGYYPSVFKDKNFNLRTKKFLAFRGMYCRMTQRNFPKIESFGLTENLMIANSCYYIASSLNEAVDVGSRLVLNGKTV